MKKLIYKLMAICPGRLQIEIDSHKLFNETAETVISRGRGKYGIHAEEMIKRNSIIRVEALPVTKPMAAAIAYHYDIELALKDVLNQINLWTPENQ